MPTDPKQLLIRQAPLRGAAYIKDRQKVYSIISDAVSGSDGWTWIRNVKDEDGRMAMLKLRDHYDGAGSRTRRVQDAKERLKTCHYKSERSFSFDKYVSTLKDCFDTLEEDERTSSERDKIDALLDGIKCSQLASAISNISMNPNLRMTFEEAANTLQREVHRVFPLVNQRGKRGISQVNTNTDEDEDTRSIRSTRRNNSIRGRSGGGRGRGRNARGGRGADGERIIINGVDITDATRTFSSQEWAKLRGHYDIVHQRRERMHAGGRGPGRGTVRGNFGGRGRGRGFQDDLPARSIQALQQANSIISEITANLNARDTTPQAEEMTHAGNSFGVASYGGRQTRFKPQGGRGPRSLSKLSSHDRRIIGAARSDPSQHPTVVESNTEIDSHADTCCLGANFLPLYYTGKVCDVTPFLDSMPAATNIEICTGATAYDDDNGNTIILVINEALWMGHHMQHTLLNPYQIRAHGVSLCDDPTDSRRFFGIETQDGRVTFKMHGTICNFRSRTPTAWELDNCQHIELTSDLEWSPTAAHFGPDISDSAPDATTAIAAYNTQHRRSDINPSTLSRQWGIGLETAKSTLRATTQLGIRHAIHPITRCYRTDYMALRHRRLHTTFYSDTLFSNVRSLTGSKCAQLTTDGLFTHIYPMASKSFAGTALHHFITDVGIPDTIIVDNAPEQTGTNSEFLRVCRQFKIQHRQIEPHTPRQNRAELSIREIKKKWRLRMQRQHVPRRLWDFGLVWVSEINNRTA